MSYQKGAKNFRNFLAKLIVFSGLSFLLFGDGERESEIWQAVVGRKDMRG